MQASGGRKYTSSLNIEHILLNTKILFEISRSKISSLIVLSQGQVHTPLPDRNINLLQAVAKYVNDSLSLEITAYKLERDRNGYLCIITAKLNLAFVQIFIMQQH